MAAGWSVNSANSALTTVTGLSGFVGLNTGNPGTVGTANTSSVTTRPSVSWAAATNGNATASTQPAWTSWAGTSPETVSYISFWNASSSGTFSTSMSLASTVIMNTGDSLTLTAIQMTIPTAS